MGCRGVLFSLTEEQVDTLKSFGTDTERLDYVQDEIEEQFFEAEPDHKVETDKAWDAIHRALTDGKLGYDNGNFPLNMVILGGEALYSADDYIMSLKTPEKVKAVAEAIHNVTEEVLRRGYFKINAEDYGFPLTDEDFAYTWKWFSALKPFYRDAAAEKRYVLFTADQ